jgi:DNA-binding transcriptional LysR family regulator
MAVPAIDPAALVLVAAIADAGSLSAAARAAGVSQPWLTKQLARIERQLGASLFNRSIRGVAPTIYGQALLARARVVRAQLALAAQDVAQLRGSGEGQVSVALSHLAIVALLPAVLPQFRRRWPQVALRFVAPAFPHRLAGLREGLPDLAIAQFPGDSLGAEFTLRPLLETSLVAVVRPGHALARSRTLAQMADAEWVKPSADSATAGALAQAFGKARLAAPRCAVFCESRTGIEAIVHASDLVGAMPAEVFDARAASSGLQRVPLSSAPRGHTLALVRWTDAQPTPAANHLAELFVGHARSLARSRRR